MVFEMSIMPVVCMIAVPAIATAIASTHSRMRPQSPMLTISETASIVQKLTRCATAPNTKASANARPVTIAGRWAGSIMPAMLPPRGVFVHAVRQLREEEQVERPDRRRQRRRERLVAREPAHTGRAVGNTRGTGPIVRSADDALARDCRRQPDAKRMQRQREVREAVLERRDAGERHGRNAEASDDHRGDVGVDRQFGQTPESRPDPGGRTLLERKPPVALD